MIRFVRLDAGRVSIVALAVLLVGWSIFWLVAWWRAGVELDARMRIEPDRGYSLACADRSIGGYPLKIVVTCRDPVVSFASDAGAITLKFPRMIAQSWLHAPSLVSIDMQGPLEVEQTGAPWAVHADWSSMTIGIRGFAPRFDRFSVWGDDVTLTCTQCPGPVDVVRVAALQTHLKRGSAPDRRTYNLAMSLAGVRSAALDSATGSALPGTIALIGSISQFHVPQSLKLVQEAERWRLDGGRINLNTLSLDKGLLHAEINGNFGIDQSHRLEGVYEVAGRNAASLVSLATGSLSPLLQLAIGAALRQVDVATSRAEETPLLRMSGTIEGGSIGLGPFRGLAGVPALY
jgi:hypothetical protein